MAKTRILTVVRPADGGIRVHLLQLLRYLQDDFSFTVACPPEYTNIFADIGCDTLPVPLAGVLRPYDDLRTIKILRSAVKKGRFAIIHAHGYKAAFLSRAVAKMTNVPCLVTVHGELVQQSSISQLYRTGERLFSRWAVGYIAVSRWLAMQLSEEFGVPKKQIAVIPNGIHLIESKDLLGEPLPFAEHVPLVGTVGRLVSQKGIIYFLQAAKVVVERMPNVRFVIVGDGPLRPELEKRCHELELDGLVYFAGYRSDVPALMRRFNVYVQPSLSEGQGITVLEAMAAGCPVVATSAGGLRELVDHGETGLLVNPGQASELADAITLMLKEVSMGRKIAEKAGRFVAQYEVTAMIRQTRDLYLGIMEGSWPV